MAERTEQARLMIPARPRHRVRDIVIVTLIVVAVAAFFFIRNHHPSGDAGGQVYAVFKHDITSAVPPGATSVQIFQSTDASWLPACPFIPGTHAGWGEVEVAVRFTDTNAPTWVGTYISSVLVSGHWQVVPRSAGSTLFHWKLPVKAGSPASAFAYPVPKGSTQWDITESWQPPGPADQGCP
jgi:hypothetical protein